MAWLRSRIERSTGVTTWAIEWREGGREGVVRSRSLGPVTEKEAEFQLAAERAGRGGLRRGAPAVTTPKKAVDAFLKHLKVSGRRQGTVDHAEDKFQPLLAEWTDRPMAKWSRVMLEGLLAERGWGTSRVRGALGVYRRFIAWCAAVGYACGDFVGDFKPPRARPLEHREALSAEQCRRLLDAARGHYLEVPVALALFAGLSRADLRAITWKEVDLETGMIARPRHKTGTRLRLPISAPLKDVFERHRQGAGRVCMRMPDDDSSLYHALHRLMDRAGVPHSGWHQLRHTAATLLAAAGTDLATIGRILGHRPGSVVTLRYLHTDDGRLREAADAAARAVRRA